MWIRLGQEAPIQFAAERLGPKVRIRDQLSLISPTSFKQQHLRLEIGRKPGSHNGARRSCATYNVIEPRSELRSEILLVYTDSLCEVFLRTIFHDIYASLSLSLGFLLMPRIRRRSDRSVIDH